MKETPPHLTTAHPLNDLKYLQLAVSTEKRSRWDATSLLWLLYQPSLNCIKSSAADRFSQENRVLGLHSECSVFLDLQLGQVSVAMPVPSSLCFLALLSSRSWRRGSEKGVGSPEVPPATVCMILTRKGSVMPKKVWESSLLGSVRELTVLHPSWDSGHRGLSVPHGEVLPVCVVGTQEWAVLTLSTKQHVFHFLDTPLKIPVAWGCPEEEGGEKAGVRNGSFSGKVIFSVDSQSLLSEIPIFGLTNLLWLWSILSHTFTCTLTRDLPSGSVVLTKIPPPHDPVTWPLWGGSHGHCPAQVFSPTGWRRGLSAVGQQGLLRAHLDAMSALSTGVRKLKLDVRY